MNQMKRLTWTSVGIVLLWPLCARAVPIQGKYQDDPNACDSHPDTFFTHELGDITQNFPTDEGITVQANLTTQVICVPDDGAPNDFVILMTNVSPYSYKDLFFVADDGATVGNYDGGITDLAAPGYTNAFKIDNVGVNNNLVLETINPNLIFEPGETWEFYVTNFVVPAALPPFPLFGSIGRFAGSSSADVVSNASIVANRIPEPTSVGLLLLGALCVATFSGATRGTRELPTDRGPRSP